MEYYTEPTGNLQPIDQMYPDTYNIVYPHVAEIAEKYANSHIDENTLENITMEIVRRSGLDLSDGVVPAINYRPGGYDPYYHRRHNKKGGYLQDLVRILFLRDLFQRRGRRHW